MKISSTTESYTPNISNTTKEENNSKDNSFDNMVDEKTQKNNTDEKVTIKSTTEELIADIMSLFKTGLTVGEIEELEKLLKELQDKIKEGDYSKNEVERMLSDIEKQILTIKKSISGMAIKELDDKSLIDNKNNISSTNDTDGFLKRIDDAIDALEELKKGVAKKEAITNPNHNESELLQMIKEFKK